MTKVLLIALASVGYNTADLTDITPANCTASVSGPTFGFSGRMYFHYTTTCDVPVDAITINASVAGPLTTAVAVKTCSFASSCSAIVGVTYKRGTWTWVNDTTYTSGTSLASKTVTYYQ